MATTSTAKIILGIDPGTVVMGYGIIRVQGQQATLIDLGVLKPGKAKDGIKRLQLIHETVSGLVRKYKPTEFAIEAPFFGKNVQSMLKLGRAQGIAMAAGLTREVPIFEYSPKQIKQSITGNGNATKEQVDQMLQRLFTFKKTTKLLDATDGLAAAVCHYYKGKPLGKDSVKSQTIKPKAKRKSSSWAQFMESNPDRIQTQ